MKNIMNTIKLLLITLLFASCSADSIEEEIIYVDNCGSITLKRYVVIDNCYEIRFESNINNTTVIRCIEEQEWLSLNIGDTFCYGQTAL
jgi:hypothetical protein